MTEPFTDLARDAEERGVVKRVHQVPEFRRRYSVLLLARDGATFPPEEGHGAVLANLDKE